MMYRAFGAPALTLAALCVVGAACEPTGSSPGMTAKDAAAHADGSPTVDAGPAADTNFVPDGGGAAAVDGGVHGGDDGTAAPADVLADGSLSDASADAGTEQSDSADVDDLMTSDAVPDLLPADASLDVQDTTGAEDGVADASAPPSDADAGQGGGIDGYVYTGPGYPMELPVPSYAEEWTSKGGLYQCDQSIELPKGADVPGPCVTFSDWDGEGFANVIKVFGYDCELRLKASFSWVTEDAGATYMPLTQRFYEWTESGDPTREESFSNWDYELKLWDYYPDGLIKSTYHLYEDLVKDAVKVETREYAYEFDEIGLLIKEIAHDVESNFDTVYLHTYNANHDLVMTETYYFYPDTGEYVPGLGTEYTYYSDGRLEYEWLHSVDGSVYGWLNSYVNVDGGEAHRVESTHFGTGVFEPERETVVDPEGRVVLSRTHFAPEFSAVSCPYGGECWGGYAAYVRTYSYQADGKQAYYFLWSGDQGLLEADHPGVYVTEYDTFGRPTHEGWWNASGKKVPAYYADDLVSHYYSCWDTGAAAGAEWGE